MMVKSILLDQNAKEWEVEIKSLFGFISAKIDTQTQNIKVYYLHDEYADSRFIKVFDFGTNQENNILEKIDFWSFLATLPQHDEHIVHHLFWAWIS